MKKTSRTVALTAVLLLAAAVLTGCGKYAARYNAVGDVRSANPTSASMSFIEFEGTQVFKLRCGGTDESEIAYTGKLETGNLTVYYDCGGAKTRLFSLGAGDSIRQSGGYLPDSTVYIIVETDGKCTGGDLTFEITGN